MAVMLGLQLLIGGVLIVVTVMVHALALDQIIRRIEKFIPFAYGRFKTVWKPVIVSGVVLAVFVAHIVEIWIWALFYLAVVNRAELPDLESALYFSTSTFTTVGFGDVHLLHDWRMISSIEAANGFMLFGWSTAFIFEIVAQLYRREAQEIKR